MVNYVRDEMSTATVTVLRWPEQSDERASLRHDGVPRLLVVSAGAMPPDDLDLLEDWVSAAADATEIEFRMATLEARARIEPAPAPTIDDDGVLRHGDRWIALGPIEARLARDDALVTTARDVAAKTLTGYREGASALPAVLQAQRAVRDAFAQYVTDAVAAANAAAAVRLATATSTTP